MVRVESINRIMDLFLDDLKKSESIRELSKEAGLSYDTTYRHVGYLLKEGVFREKKVGRTRLCSINFGNKEARMIIGEASLRRTNNFLKKDHEFESLFREGMGRCSEELPGQVLSIVLYGIKGINIDLLILVSNTKVKKDIERICRETSLKYGKKVRAIVANPVEFKKALGMKKGADKEEIVYGKVLYGYEEYYTLLFECMQ